MLEAPIILDAVEGCERRRHGATARQFYILTASFWTVEVLLAELRSMVDHSPKLFLYTGLRLATAALGCLECWLIHLFAQRTLGATMQRRWTFVLTASALAGLANLGIGDALQNLSAYHVADHGGGWRIYNATYWALMFMAWGGLYLALSYTNDAIEQERCGRLLEQLANEAQTRALRFQIDPHFLFNTLNSVSALVLARRHEDAEMMIRRLSAFFRTTLLADPRREIRLSEEIALQRTYLEIERVRFPDLSIEIDVHDGAARAFVPPMLLQPVVENAVKFAVAGRNGPARIGITAPEPVWGRVTVEVWDDGAGADGDPAEGTGTGLANVRERLRLRFGDAASLWAGRRRPRGFRVHLTLPHLREMTA